MTKQTYRLRIVKGDQQFEAEGDRAFVLEMLKRFEGVGPSLETKAKKTTRATISMTGKELSPGEFIRQLGLKRHTDIVLGFGYYLEHHSGVKEFTPADINNLYYEAKMESSNTSQMFISNVRKGFLMEAKLEKGGKRRYTLTRSGEEYIKAKLVKKAE